MKTKFTRFILMITFIMPTVHCNVDTKEFDFPFCSKSPNPDLSFNDEENNQVIEPPTNSSSSSEEENNVDEPYFNNNEISQIRQSLIGIYQGVLNNQYTILEVRTLNTLYIIRNGEEISYNYEVILEQYGVRIVFTMEGIEHRHYLGTTDYPGGNLRVIRIFTDNNHFLDKVEDINELDS